MVNPLKGSYKNLAEMALTAHICYATVLMPGTFAGLLQLFLRTQFNDFQRAIVDGKN